MNLALWLKANRKSQKWLAEEIARLGHSKPRPNTVSGWCDPEGGNPSLKMANAIITVVNENGGGLSHWELEKRGAA